jgi:hypothetical protein
MQDFTLSDFMDYYKELQQTLSRMHITAMKNLDPICKGCLKQEACWNGFRFIDLLLYEDRTCLNYLQSDNTKSCETCKVKNVCTLKDTLLNGAKRRWCSEYGKE